MVYAGVAVWHKAGAKMDATPIVITKIVRLNARCFTYMISTFSPRSYHFTSPQPAPLFRQHDGIGRVLGIVFHANRVDRRKIERHIPLQHRDILRRGVFHSANAIRIRSEERRVGRLREALW